MIQFYNVFKRYENGFEALQNISLGLEKGEMAFLTGHSGAGKSTLLKLIMRMEVATRGQVNIDGINLNNLARRHLPYLRRKIGLVFQDHQLLYDRNVYDNVALPLYIDGMEPQDITRRVHAALDKVGLLSKVNLKPIALSGGEQQRVGIARAVVNKPPILLADEPTGNLDPKLSAEIMQLFRQFSAVGVTVLIASHDLDLISRMGVRILELNQGNLLRSGATA